MQRVASLPADAFEERSEGLPALWSGNAGAKAVMQRFAELTLRVDTTNQCHPPQHRFIPQFYKAEASGSTILVVNMRIDEKGGRGCGPVVEWVLTPDVSAAKEKAEITRIGTHIPHAFHTHTHSTHARAFLADIPPLRGRAATNRSNDELERRDRAVRDAVRDNERAQDRYKRDIKDYESAMRRFEKERVEKHPMCKGTGWMPCGGAFHKGNSIMRSCQYCNGKGGHTCSLCKGTGLKHPNLKPPAMPKQPKATPIPTFPSIDSIDFTRNIS
jgi:hypothetical protein